MVCLNIAFDLYDKGSLENFMYLPMRIKLFFILCVVYNSLLLVEWWRSIRDRHALWSWASLSILFCCFLSCSCFSILFFPCCFYIIFQFFYCFLDCSIFFHQCPYQAYESNFITPIILQLLCLLSDENKIAHV